jgi:hypothetical protein
MKSVRYAIYLGIFLHFLRRCLRKSLTHVKHPSIDLSGEIGGRESLPESLRPAYDEMVTAMDRETLKAMVDLARTEKPSYGFRFADKLVNAIRAGRMLKDIQHKVEGIVNVGYMEVTSVDTSHDKDGNVIPAVGVNAILSKPVEYVEMKVSG